MKKKLWAVLVAFVALTVLPHPHLPQYGGVMSHLSTLASPQVTTATHVKSVVSLAQPKLIAPLFFMKRVIRNIF